MAQTEEMKRLLWKGKPVGLAWYHYDVRAGRILEEYRDLINPDYTFNKSGFDEDNYIEYDSFEQGIKVGDEWWFDGDRYELICDVIGTALKKGDKGTLVFGIYEGFRCKWNDGFHSRLIGHHLENSKKIGTIHDKE